jgi:hypothetical protein
VSVADAPTQVLDRSAALQEHVRAFTALYEEAAYVVYNVALRITCEREVAMQTAERAFLAQVDHENDQVRLIASTARVALSVASERPDPHGAGDEECEALLALNAQLPPLERAALALGALIEADDDTIAQLLGITTDAVGRLLHQGMATFAELRGSSPEETAAAIDGWLLAEPPPALWETIYPAFHRRVETQLEARPPVEQTAAAAPAQPAPAPADRTPRFSRARARARAILWTVAVLAILGGGGYAAAAALSGGGSSGAQSTVGQRPLPPGVTGGDGSMSPQELDRLRQREIQAQARGPAEHGGRPSTGPRVPSKSKQDALLRRAKANQRLAKQEEAKRERAIARQRQKAASHSTPAVPPPTPAPSTPRAHTAPTTTSGATGNTPTSSTPSTTPSSTTSSGDGAPTTSQANQNCLLNPDTGTYVCPK